MRWISFPFLRKNINDLNGVNILSEVSLKQLREKATIVIIDDEDFPLQSSLEALGYKFTNKTGNADDTNINDYIRYDMILCDISGVAHQIDPQYEGAFLASEIKKAYPEKIVISYTANGYRPDVYSFQRILDGIVFKGQGIDEWTGLLDEKIKMLVDPKAQWKRYRDRLLDEDVDINLVASMESDYVKAVLRGDFTSFNKLYKDNRRLQKAIASMMGSLMVRILMSKI